MKRNFFANNLIFISLLITSLIGFCSILSAQNLDYIPLRTIDGDTITLSKFQNKKILIVNTASKCGYTPQYADLEKLSKEYKDKLVVIGFPTDNFMNQEFKNADEIKSFCEKNYGVTFPLMDKVNVRGNDIHPLFQLLLNEKTNQYGKIDINWNFHKILLDEHHHIIKDFPTKMPPLSEELIKLL